MRNNPKIWIVCAVAAGVLWGALRPLFMQADDLAVLIANLHQFSANFRADDIRLANIWLSLFRHGHILLLIWACSAVPRMFWAVYLLIYMRVMTLAFSAALMIRAFGSQGILMFASLNLLQNVLILTIASFIICAIRRDEPPKKVILISLAVSAVILASLYEIFIAPIVFGGVL